MAELTDIRETVRQKYAEAAEAAARGEFKQARAIESAIGLLRVRRAVLLQPRRSGRRVRIRSV